MSGLETAASAFAVVGAADVVFRLGIKVYGFLNDIADAPQSLQTLRDGVRDVTALARACQTSQQTLRSKAQTSQSGPSPSQVDSALKAVERALQPLKNNMAKFAVGAPTTWTRVKYVLDEKKIEKSLISLERSKTLLMNALILAHGEDAVAGHQAIEMLLHQSLQEITARVDNLADTFESALSDQAQRIESQLNTNNASITASGLNLQRQIASGLKRSDGAMTRIIAQNQALDLNLKSSLKNQHNALSLSYRTKVNIEGISRNVKETRTTLTMSHAENRAMITGLSRQIADMGQSLSKQPAAAPGPGGRRIQFLGERREQIMYALSALHEHMRIVNDMQTFQNEAPIIAPRYAFWLESEIRALQGSAAQEEALRWCGSSARAFDDWRYPGINPEPLQSDSTLIDEGIKVNSQPIMYTSRKSNRRRKKQYDKITTTSKKGTLHITLQRSATKARTQDQPECVDLYFVGVSDHSPFILNARFERTFAEFVAPQLCIQLNMFTLVEGHAEKIYMDMFYNSSLPEIDDAFRTGILSPYSVLRHSYSDMNLCLYWAVRFCRLDVLEYLDQQGIGIRALRQDDSVFMGVGNAIVPINSTYQLRGTLAHVYKSIAESDDAIDAGIWSMFENTGKWNTQDMEDWIEFIKSFVMDEDFDRLRDSECVSLRWAWLVFSTMPEVTVLRNDRLRGVWLWTCSVVELAIYPHYYVLVLFYLLEAGSTYYRNNDEAATTSSSAWVWRKIVQWWPSDNKEALKPWRHNGHLWLFNKVRRLSQKEETRAARLETSSLVVPSGDNAGEYDAADGYSEEDDTTDEYSEEDDTAEEYSEEDDTAEEYSEEDDTAEEYSEDDGRESDYSDDAALDV
ncbi:hypothetical protein ACN47E_001644 [Coniothyrium glycines]